MADMNIMDWNDTIENDGESYAVLPEGDYTFTVSTFERGSFPGGPKTPPCKQAVLTLAVNGGEAGMVSVRTNLILYRTMEWKISAFFRSIGLKKHGEKLVMDWNRVQGAHGRCHMKPRTYTGNDGKPHETNEVVSYLDYDPTKMGFTEAKNDALPWESESGGGF